MRRKEEEASKVKQTNNKAKQHSTPKVVTFLLKKELPRVGFEPTTLYTLTHVHVHVRRFPVVFVINSASSAVLEGSRIV